MKLELAKDLTALRDEALAAVDRYYARARSGLIGINADIRAMKASEARALIAMNAGGREIGRNCALLRAEAEHLGISLEQHALSVLDRHHDQSVQLAALEVARQKAQAKIAVAALPGEIDAVLTEALPLVQGGGL
jgi:hypothetical protein